MGKNEIRMKHGLPREMNQGIYHYPIEYMPVQQDEKGSNGIQALWKKISGLFAGTKEGDVPEKVDDPLLEK